MPNLRGTIGPNGYQPPSDVTIYWWHPSSNEVIAKRLNPNVPITSHYDLNGRYGGGDPALNGWQTYPAISSEGGGGEAFPIYQAWCRQHGLVANGESAQFCDFVFAELAQQGQLTVGCAGYGLVGLVAPPGCVDSVVVKPGQPRITALSSPRAGVVHVEWQSKPGATEFEIELEHTNGEHSFVTRRDGGPSATYSTDVDGLDGGEYSVTVTAYIGNTAGAPSIAKRVTVVGATSEPPVEPPTPVEPPPPPVVEPPPPPPPPLDGPPHGGTPTPTTPPKLSAESRQTIADWRGWVRDGKPIGSERKRRVTAVFDEVERLLPSP